MMPRTPLAFAAAVLAALFSFGTIASAASPQLVRIMPRGGQRGTEARLAFVGNRLDDVAEVLMYEPGFEVVSLEVKATNRVEAVVKIASDCRLGEHSLRLRAKSGISELQTFYVGPFAEVPEKEPNTEFTEPQPIELNVTVTGVIQAEDVDFFVVNAKKGQRISAEIEAIRLGVTLFDPYIAILDARRFELAAADDTPLLMQDAAVSIIAPEDGPYYIQVRESAYAGNGNCMYRLHVGTFPRPLGIYPAGGKLGAETEVTFVGDVTGPFKQNVKLPENPVTDFGIVAEQAGELAPSPNPFRLSTVGNVLEVEPNNELKTASPAELPLAFNGIISEPGDVDFFRFTAKKGETFEINCHARSLRSPLDPVMELLDANGRRLSLNDDSRGLDAYFRYAFPADGEYVISITDHLGNGGVNFVYRIEFTKAEPQFTFTFPEFRRYGQDRHYIAVPRGGRYASIINGTRQGVAGDIVPQVDGLPEGVTMASVPMNAALNVMPIYFEAAADAPLGGKLVDLRGRAADGQELIPGGFRQDALMIIGNPGQSVYWSRTSDRLAVAVVDEFPFSIEIAQPKAPLVKNGTLTLKIVATRKEGFTGAINVEFPFRPPGVAANPSVQIPADKTEVDYPISANANAAVGNWKVFCLASSEVSGLAYVSSQLADLEISEPFVTFEVERAAVEQGQPCEVFCKITHNTPFEGKAVAQLLGLPTKVTSEPIEFTKETQEVVFKLQTDPTSPEGRHRSIICQLTIPVNGDQIVATGGVGEVRIDKPLPAPVTPVAPVAQQPAQPVETKPAPAPTTQKPPEKRLTRLEQLRLDAAKKAAQEAGGNKE